MERKKSVNDAAGYHCQAWKCVMDNKGLQKQKKKKKGGEALIKVLKNPLLT